jgi:acetyltransferase
MIYWPGYEFAMAAKKDPTFGSIIVFGLGGQLLEAEKDYAAGIPPLNQTLARRLIEETRICRYLLTEGKRRPRMDQLEEALVRFSILVADFPQIKEIDINPFYLGKEEGTCLDGRIVLEEEALEGFQSHQGAACPDHMVICPYPCHYIYSSKMKDGTPYLIRPIKPEDEPLMEELFYSFSQETVRNRFFQYKKEISHEELARYCQVDYDREIALVAAIDEDGRERLIGVSRLTIMPDGRTAELAVVVSDAWQGQGIGKRLMENAIKIARERGIREIWMDVLSDNKPMNGLSKSMGFKKAKSEDPDIVRYVLRLKK